MGEPRMDHYRIETEIADEGGTPVLSVRAVPLDGKGVEPSATSATLASLATEDGLVGIVQWAESLPWDNEEWRSKHASYHETIFAERRGEGWEPGWNISAYNDFTEEFTDGETLFDKDVLDAGAWREVLQWAESLGKLT